MREVRKSGNSESALHAQIIEIMVMIIFGFPAKKAALIGNNHALLLTLNRESPAGVSNKTSMVV